MFGRQHTLKQLSGGIAIAAALAVIAVPTAAARTVITDTLGGNGSPKAQPDVFERYVAIHHAQHQAQGGMQFTTDTLGGNGSPKTDVFERSVAIQEARQAAVGRQAVAQARAVWAGISPGTYVHGGMPARPQVNASSASVQPGKSGFNWTAAGVGLGLVAVLLALLLVLGGPKRRQQRRVLAV